MGKQTKIEWCDATFNPWTGCSPVSDGCVKCYAKRITERWGKIFVKRSRTGIGTWNLPERLERRAVKTGQPIKLFCGSMCDWLDDQAAPGWRSGILDLIAKTPHVTWLLLTKRPENWFGQMRRIVQAENGIAAKLALDWTEYDQAPENIWFGVTAENQEMWNKRVKTLRCIPAKIKWVSAEPLLEEIIPSQNDMSFVNWVVAGGEKGKGARLCEKTWLSELHFVCEKNKVPFFFKQWGSNTPACDKYYADLLSMCRQWPEIVERSDEGGRMKGRVESVE